MKRLFVTFDGWTKRPMLVIRAKNRTRHPLDVRFCYLRDDEITRIGKRRSQLAFEGRFSKFSPSPFTNRASIPTLLRPFFQIRNSRVEEMIEWIVERDLRWSFDVVAEKVARSRRWELNSGFSFDEVSAAVEFHLIFG